MKLPELLSPAGDLDRVQTALLYGADAVYLAGRPSILRAGSLACVPRRSIFRIRILRGPFI